MEAVFGKAWVVCFRGVGHPELPAGAVDTRRLEKPIYFLKPSPKREPTAVAAPGYSHEPPMLPKLLKIHSCFEEQREAAHLPQARPGTRGSMQLLQLPMLFQPTPLPRDKGAEPQRASGSTEQLPSGAHFQAEPGITSAQCHLHLPFSG